MLHHLYNTNASNKLCLSAYCIMINKEHVMNQTAIFLW